MLKKVMRVFLTVAGILLGTGVARLLKSYELITPRTSLQNIALYIISAVAIGGMMFMVSPIFLKLFQRWMSSTEKGLEKIPLTDIVLGALGLIIGLIIAFFISQPVLSLDIPFFGSTISVLLSIILYLILGILCMRVALKNKQEIFGAFERMRGGEKEKRERVRTKKDKSIPKILDTSVLIDGRIVGVIESGFLEGPFIISELVLEELQHIADSSDPLRRERGRRGLDGIKDIQKTADIDVVISHEKYDDIREVDHKLLKLTLDNGGKIVTNDYNLNKVAEVQGLSVLNINDLANVLKPVVIPGEMMHVSIIKEGKEADQGLAYLDDGTMVVIENGKRAIGKQLDVVVTSVLQTSAGKMIFARIQ